MSSSTCLSGGLRRLLQPRCLRLLSGASVLAGALAGTGPGWAQPAPTGTAAPALTVPQPPGGAIQAASLADALARAIATNPRLASARGSRRQAEFQAIAAGALPPVILNVGAHAGRDAAADDEDIFLSGRIELGSKRRLRAEAAGRLVTAARAREAQAMAELTFLVRSGFADLQSAAAEELLARQNLDLARTFLRLAEAQFEAGEVAMTNVLRAQVEVENADQAVTAAAAATAARRAALNVAIGAEPAAPLELPELALVPARELSLESLRELAQNRPDVRAARALLASRQASLGVARTARQPDLTLDAAHRSLTSLEGNVLRVGVAFPLVDFGVTRANAEAARAAIAEQRAELDLLRRQALQEVEIAYRNLIAARQQAERLGGPQLERARRLRELAELGYSEGEFSYLELLDAQRTYLATFTQYLRAVAAANAAEADLQRAVGGTLPGGP